jgi:hypothetical protein
VVVGDALSAVVIVVVDSGVVEIDAEVFNKS